MAYLYIILKALAKGDQQNVRRSEEKKTKNEYFRNTNCNRPCLWQPYQLSKALLLPVGTVLSSAAGTMAT